MENSAVISVHARPVAEEDLLSDVSEDQVYTDLNGRGRIPSEMRDAISDYSSLLFTGFYATECVKRGIESVQSDFDIYLAENLTYEQIGEELYSVQDIRSNEEMDDRNILRALYLDTEIEDYLRI